MPELTTEQSGAVRAGGKTIVSASAGSGKTFVMIARLCDYVEQGGDLDGVLAITYTQKAAAQMKEKLRASLITRLKDCPAEKRAHVKEQLNKVPYADVSTVHSFCSRLIRTYFYAAGIDGSFDIAGEDGGGTLLKRASDDLFEELYESGDEDFLFLLEFYRKKRGDGAFKYMMQDSYADLRNVPDYLETLDNMCGLYNEEGFERVCAEYHDLAAQTLERLIQTVNAFERDFVSVKNAERYAEIFAEMRANMQAVIDEDDIFVEKPPLYSGVKPRDGEEDKEAGAAFSDFRDGLTRRYRAVYEDLKPREEEYEKFISSGKIVKAYCGLLKKFDEKYAAVKREEGRLDYNDLEHLALKLLDQPEVLEQVRGKYRRVFVDEYQDVNPVQERIIDRICGGDVFLVGDVKQAIYGFRGSKSRFFSEKYDEFSNGGGNALNLSYNFRSADAVIGFVNDLFSQAMDKDLTGFSYARNGFMRRGGGYPAGYGRAQVDWFGKDEADKTPPRAVYSVKENAGGNLPHTRLSLAVLKIVEEELKKDVYDLSVGAMRPVQTGDICILTRKRANEEAVEIARALRDAGYSVSGVKEDDVRQTPEVKCLLDILSLIDNAEQDIPTCSFMLSPLGGFTEEELARVRIPFKGVKGITFRECARRYSLNFRDEIAQKINRFYGELENLRGLSEIMGAGSLIDKICADAGWEAMYAANGGERLKNIRALQQAAYAPSGELSLSAFLRKLSENAGDISAPDCGDTDSIKIMTMHSSKGLEFPVVILADICSSFKGQGGGEMPFDEKYGFTPRWYDAESKSCGSTILRRLCKLRGDREELKNELNLFYVACTRAMYSLHVTASEIKNYNPADALYARSYAQVADFTRLNVRQLEPAPDFPRGGREVPLLGSGDGETEALIERNFMRPYAHAESVDLPVKSSASRLLQENIGESVYAVHNLFKEDEAPARTGAERGTAYHRFLQLCDFNKKSAEEVEAELSEFVKSGNIPEEQRALLSVENLVKIVNMSVFSSLSGKIYREREFLCRLKANEFLPTDSEDYVLVQGAVDLLAVTEGSARIIDYKYSAKSDEQLAATYAPQLGLYKKVVSVICGISEDKIKTAIVNINRLSEINL